MTTAADLNGYLRQGVRIRVIVENGTNVYGPASADLRDVFREFAGGIQVRQRGRWVPVGRGTVIEVPSGKELA